MGNLEDVVEGQIQLLVSLYQEKKLVIERAMETLNTITSFRGMRSALSTLLISYRVA